jgi:HEPN domain-containing protein
MKIEEQIKFWVDSAKHDMTVAEHLFEKGDYSWCLFVGHLVLEKMLKAIYIRDSQRIPPRIHDLVRLAESTKLILDKEQKEFLFEVNTFNIEARYPDEKSKFYELCTNEFTTENFTKVKDMYQWLKSQI